MCKNDIERNSSLGYHHFSGLKWVNKTYKLKRSDHAITIESILVFLSYLIFLANLCEEFNLQSGCPSSLFVFGGLIAGYARFEK